MIDANQFVISKYKYICDNWKYLRMKSDLWLSYHEGLKIVWNEEKSVLLLGDAWQVDSKREDPDEIVVKMDSGMSDKQIMDIEESWCGRYVLIVGKKLFLDSMGLRGVYFSEKTVSSSLHIITIIEKLKIKYPKIHYGTGLDYLPGGITQYANVKRLLPSQILNYESKETYYRPLLPNGIKKYDSDEERVDGFINYFVTSLKNMRKKIPGEYWLALTGGVDSRTAMALLEKAGIDYKVFTLHKDNISIGDAEVPKELCKKLNREYRYIIRNKKNYDKKRLKEYKKHTMGQMVGSDMYYYAYGQYEDLRRGSKESIVILKSAVWEAATRYYRKMENDYLDVEHMNKSIGTLKYDHIARRALEKWISDVHKNNLNEEMNDIDRFFWEQRLGCWASVIDLGYDLYPDIKAFQLCNCRLYFSIMHGFDVSIRNMKVKGHQMMMMKKACPEVLEIPFGNRNSIKKNSPQKAELMNTYWCFRLYGITPVIDVLKGKIMNIVNICRNKRNNY